MVGQRVVDETSGATGEGAEAGPPSRAWHQRAEPDLALSSIAMVSAMRRRGASVLVEVELAGEQEGVEREAVRGRGECAPEMLAPEAAHAPANRASSRGWLGANSDAR